MQQYELSLLLLRTDFEILTTEFKCVKFNLYFSNFANVTAKENEEHLFPPLKQRNFIMIQYFHDSFFSKESSCLVVCETSRQSGVITSFRAP